MRQARQPSTPMLVFASCTLYLISSSNTRSVHQYTFTFLLSPFFSLRSLWESSTNVGPRPKGCSLVQQMKENPSPSKREHALCDALFPVIHQQHSDMDTNLLKPMARPHFLSSQPKRSGSCAIKNSIIRCLSDLDVRDSNARKS